MRRRSRVFLDETGNTGSNLLDLSQPVYIEGGWYVSRERQWDAEVAVKTLERMCGFSRAEAKGARLSRHPKGRAFIAEVCRTLGGAGCIPFMFVAEKRYVICGKIVETFFDSEYNPKVPREEGWNPDLKKEQAQIFYDSQSPLIEEFASAYRSKDGPAVLSNVLKWEEEFRRKGLADFAEQVRGVAAEVETEIASEAAASTSGEIPSGLDSLNFPMIVAVFQYLEQQVPAETAVIHDEIQSFQDAYQYIFNLLTKGERRGIELLDGTRFVAGFRNVTSLSFSSGQLEPLLRAADYLVAGTRYFIQETLAERQLDNHLANIGFRGLGGILCEVLSVKYPSLGFFPKLGSLLCSTKWAVRVMNAVVAGTGIDKKEAVPSAPDEGGWKALNEEYRRSRPPLLQGD